jgi:hypothetical protein
MASSIEKTFSRITHVDTDIHAGIEQVWELLTNTEKQSDWNSTLKSIKGNIGEEGKVEVITKLDPSQTFKLKVTSFDPPNSMTWSSGMAPFFKGEREYRLTRMRDTATYFEMKETMKGLMFPLASKHIPDMKPSFDQIVRDLKQAAEG